MKNVGVPVWIMKYIVKNNVSFLRRIHSICVLESEQIKKHIDACLTKAAGNLASKT